MKKRQEYSLATYHNAKSFVLKHGENGDVLAPVIESGVWRDFVATIDQLQEQATAQKTHGMGTRSGTATLAVARRTLLEHHINPIVAFAATFQDRFPELVVKAPGRRESNTSLVNSAGAMANNVNNYAHVFIDLGLEPDFLDRMRAAAHDLVLAIDARGAVNSQKVGATAGIRATIQVADTHLRAIGTLVVKHAGRRREMMAEWRVVRRLPAHGHRALGAGVGGVSKGALAGSRATVVARVKTPKALSAGPSAKKGEAEVQPNPDYEVSVASAPRRLLAGVTRLFTRESAG